MTTCKQCGYKMCFCPDIEYMEAMRKAGKLYPEDKTMPNIDGTPHGTHDFENETKARMTPHHQQYTGNTQRDIETLANMARDLHPIKVKAKTEFIAPGIDEVPFEGIAAVGEIFAEGHVKYGRDNWKNGLGDVEYQRERCRHAIRHLHLWANGDRSERHLAKVAWFCLTQIWIESKQDGN